MQQLCSNQCNENRNKRLEKVRIRITHVHVEVIEKHIKLWHMKRSGYAPEFRGRSFRHTAMPPNQHWPIWVRLGDRSVYSHDGRA